MSTRTAKSLQKSIKPKATLFAALGDETRLTLVVKLSQGSLLSITQLAEDSAVTRQAITKHLRVLEESGIVRGVRRGRENLFRLEPKAIAAARESLDRISMQWDEALASLKAFVEK